MGFVGVNHVDVEMTRAVVCRGHIERHGIEDIHDDLVAVGCISIGRRDGHCLDTNLLEVENQVAGHQTGGTGFGRLRVVHPVGSLGAVNIGKTAVEVDHLLTVGLQGEFLDVRHVKTRSVVDGVHSEGDGLVGELLAIACSQCDHGFTVHVVIDRFKAKILAAKFNIEDFGV